MSAELSPIARTTTHLQLTQRKKGTVNYNIKTEEDLIKAIEKDLSGLIKSDWKTPDGKEIKNKAVLEEIHGAKSDLQKQNITLKCNWVKGHSRTHEIASS
jgi:ribonuclease HI